VWQAIDQDGTLSLASLAAVRCKKRPSAFYPAAFATVAIGCFFPAAALARCSATITSVINLKQGRPRRTRLGIFCAQRRSRI
jgi:hypothetical protein